jgi:hypothetical protein
MISCMPKQKNLFDFQTSLRIWGIKGTAVMTERIQLIHHVIFSLVVYRQQCYYQLSKSW